MRSTRRSRPDAPARRPAGPDARHSVADATVYAAILALGAMHYALALRPDDFFRGDTTYFEVARSLLARGSYGFNFQPQTVLPPGFPAVMAMLCTTVGCGYSVFIHAVVVSSTLGFLASYELLRREEGRAAAAVVCLLLLSSPAFFLFATGLVFSDLPYLLLSMLTLLLINRLDASDSGQALVHAEIHRPVIAAAGEAVRRGDRRSR
jgi:hypothetical protein